MNSGPFDLNYKEVAGVWNHGSVIRSWLMELTENLFSKDSTLSGIKDVIDSTGEGLWSLQEALDLQVPTPVLAQSIYARFDSKRDESFSNKIVAGLRNEFGGHSVVKK